MRSRRRRRTARAWMEQMRALTRQFQFDAMRPAAGGTSMNDKLRPHPGTARNSDVVLHRRRRARQPLRAARRAGRIGLHRAGGHQRRGRAAARAQALPDIVLLDAMMPGMDGFEVAKRLKAAARNGAHPHHLHDRPDRNRAPGGGPGGGWRGLRDQADQAQGGAGPHGMAYRSSISARFDRAVVAAVAGGASLEMRNFSNAARSPRAQISQAAGEPFW